MGKPNGSGSLLSKQAILDAEDLEYKVVHVPAWGGDVRIRELTGTERDQFESVFAAAQAGGGISGRTFQNIRAKLCAMCIVGDDGERYFTDAEMQALGKKSAKALATVYLECARLSGIAAEAVEEEGKDSATIDGVASSSASA